MVFESAVRTLIDLGFYAYLLPFVISLAFIYALLRKGKIFESPVAAGVVSLAISLAIIAFPLMVGVSLEKPFSVFFTQLTIITIVIGIVLLMAAMFVPNVAEVISNLIKTPAPVIAVFAVIVGVLFFTSGLVEAFFVSAAAPAFDYQAFIFVIALLLMVALIILAAKVAG